MIFTHPMIFFSPVRNCQILEPIVAHGVKTFAKTMFYFIFFILTIRQLDLDGQSNNNNNGSTLYSAL